MRDIFTDNNIIAATRSDAEFLCATESAVSVIFDLDSDIMTLSKKIKAAHESGKKLYVHIDLARGIGKDTSGIVFLKKMGVDGVISTKVSIIKLAREAGLSTVQRFFIVDSRSVHTTIEAVGSSRPDMIEIMPATVGKVITRLVRDLDIPVIAGGLIETEAEARAAIECGAAAVSTGQKTLWQGATLL